MFFNGIEPYDDRCLRIIYKNYIIRIKYFETIIKWYLKMGEWILV